ncbi:MAG: xanthine dehydrogenase family protein molybdopterin-binding subunit [Proteobacteria bacterium]|nr:xanthine dehydrogenase family protein molybdopterin-binding subunit [Pseudomonadota bacterium]
MGRFALGQPVRRKEDVRFLTGKGRYLDDLSLPGEAFAAFVRSPHAHARVRALDAAVARRMPGVLGVFTGVDVDADGLGTLPTFGATPKAPGGGPAAAPPRRLIARERVRFAGEIVALVVAETRAGARDAAEKVEVAYEPLAAIADLRSAVRPGAPLVWDKAPGNVSFVWRTGDARATEAAFRKAAHVTRLALVNNRLEPSPMETRGGIGAFDAATGRYTLHLSSQGVHTIRALLAKEVLKVASAKVRVVTPDVGGAFGLKIFLFPEEALLPWAAAKVGRPVKWTAERSESFLSDTHGRDQASEAELALEKDGTILALRVSTLANMGAYLSLFAPEIPTAIGAVMLAGVYRFAAAQVSVTGVLTHTGPVDAYRGAGRPEAAYLIERLIDAAGRELGLAPEEIRRRNFIPPSAMPFTTALGETYDSGDFERNLADALRLSGHERREERRRAARARGRLYGFGLATYIESCGGGADEQASLRFEPDDTVTVLVGTQSNGHGHETVFAQIAADSLGLDIERVKVVQGDTDLVSFGRGTGGSRALPVAGNAVLKVAERAIERGKEVAAHLLEAARADIVFADGRFAIAGTDRSLSLFEVARAAREDKSLPPAPPRPAKEAGLSGLDADLRFAPSGSTYPNGCHACEVEVDPETGAVEIVGYTVVDDFGVVANPPLLAGQVHGGVAQGIGQALLEGCVYDPGSGQLLTGSFVDYALPRADRVPPIAFRYNVIPTRANPLGIKGAGEAGAVGAPPAVINAVVDALAHLGVRHVEMPATPERVWRAIRAAAGR